MRLLLPGETAFMRDQHPALAFLGMACTICVLAFAGTLPAREQVLSSLEKEISSLVENARPSVVSVMASYRAPASNQDKTQRQGSAPSRPSSPQWLTNVGSGCVIDSRGYILTTENVVRNAEQFQVAFSDGHKTEARLAGSDVESNIAVLQIEPGSYPEARIGNSDELSIGSWITLLGNSFGLTSAVSFGLVNGLRERDNLIQMSAPVSPGNSGAIALNIKGEVVGLVVATVSEPVTLTLGASGDRETHSQQLDLPSLGASLAIPMNRAMHIAAELIEHGKYDRGWIGIIIRDLSAAQAQRLGIGSGIVVSRVLPASPAAEANLLEQDIVISFDGRQISSGRQLMDWVQSSPIGKSILVTVLRQGREYSLNTTIASRPANLQETMTETGLNWSQVDKTVGSASAPLSKDADITHRIEQLEEEIRKLQRLVRKDQ